MAYGLDLLLSALHVLGVEIVSSSFDDLLPARTELTSIRILL
jgi:hypothetical protein